jgi:hypothetical protein
VSGARIGRPAIGLIAVLDKREAKKHTGVQQQLSYGRTIIRHSTKVFGMSGIYIHFRTTTTSKPGYT